MGCVGAGALNNASNPNTVNKVPPGGTQQACTVMWGNVGLGHRMVASLLNAPPSEQNNNVKNSSSSLTSKWVTLFTVTTQGGGLLSNKCPQYLQMALPNGAFTTEHHHHYEQPSITSHHHPSPFTDQHHTGYVIYGSPVMPPMSLFQNTSCSFPPVTVNASTVNR